jgi:carboxyl-terminal processing protease
LPTALIVSANPEPEGVLFVLIAPGIDELILDLRYNGGGRTHVAGFLSELIAGDHVDEEIFVKYLHNDKFSDWDWVSEFSKPENALNLTRVVIITTASTCSASELVINSLKPFVNVVLVGTTTCGKPVGMHGYDFGDKHISPIEFQGVNALGAGEYFDGIVPTCSSDDDLTKLFGDSEESSLGEALHYLTQGSCTVKRTLKALAPRKEIRLHGFRREIGAF